MRVKSSSQHKFAQIPDVKLERSAFKRDRNYKSTMAENLLIPFYIEEVVPGDSVNLNATMFARLATPLKPIMDNMYLDTFFFFCPNRLVWDNWVRFMGEQDNPTDSTSYVVPTMTSTASTGYLDESIHDYFGIPTGVPGLIHSSLWHRFYNLCWNQWFRDQNLQTSVTVRKTDTGDLPTDYTLLKRGKRHDYFTSCLPWPQKGAAVTLPLGTSAPVYGIGTYNKVYSETGNFYESGQTATRNFAHAKLIDPSSADSYKGSVYVEGFTATDSFPNIRADLAAATAATINQLRQAFQVQRLLERDARGGSKYIEIIRSHFSVTSPDFRLQRVEYLGGGSSNISISPVVQNSSGVDASGTLVTTPQGNLSAIGTGTSSHGFTKSFTEHGMIMGLVSIRADLTYQKGLHRMFSRSTKYDFYWPSLSHLGEQAVLNKEIYAQGTGHIGTGATQDEGVFGYQERYAEMRFGKSLITGKFKSHTASGRLDVWHLSQEFSALPALGATFIQEGVPVARVIAVDSEPHFIFDSYISEKWVRPMPVYSVPGLIDHL